MKLLNKLKQISILNILTILVITLILSLANNYLSKKPLDLIYKPKPIVDDNILFGESLNTNVINSEKKSNEIINNNIDNSINDSLKNKTQFNNQTNQVENPILTNNPKSNISQEQKVETNNLQTAKKEFDNSLKENTLDNLEKVVNYNQVLKIIGNQNFVIIDARSIDDYKKGKIGNAINIFPYNENENEYFQQIMSLPREKRFLIYCTGGNCDLSHHLAKDMANFGFTNIFIYVGGWEDWEKKSKKK